jgi:TetR/AcrR family transcriptional regulator, cholesterol catabolism regulator
MPPKPQRRPQILKSAASLFLSRGFQSTTMDDLAAKLKLNKATIYHHFPGGKQELLYEIISRALEGVTEDLDQVDPETPPEERLRAYLRAMVRFQGQHPDETVVYFQQRPWLKQNLSRPQFKAVAEHEAHARDLIRRGVEDGIEAGDFMEVDPSLTTFGLMNVVTSSYEWFRHRDRDDADIADFYADVTFDGLKTNPRPKKKATKKAKRLARS